MTSGLKITAVEPRYAIPGGEIVVECEDFDAGFHAGGRVMIDEETCTITAASSHRIVVRIPEGEGEGRTHIQIEVDAKRSEPFPIVIGKLLTGDMHIVANPAIDPSDDALILTRSGSRGQHLPATLFRLEPDGYLDELPEAILNPTGIAFDKDGQMFVTNRAQGEVYSVGRDGTSSVYATGLGIATGIAFDAEGRMYVGDRSGTVHRVREFAEVETFTVMEPSVAAYHMAFGRDGRLFLTAPGLASHDAVHVIDKEGFDEVFFRGLGRPQGLAFDREGNLYVAACYRGRHGVVKIAADGSSAEQFVAGNNVVGLCFTRAGEMIVATNNSVYSIPCGVEGTILS
jgi:sugar lactone lactonase YvrE